MHAAQFVCIRHEVIKLFSYSTQLSMELNQFKFPVSTEIANFHGNFRDK